MMCSTQILFSVPRLSSPFTRSLNRQEWLSFIHCIILINSDSGSRRGDGRGPLCRVSGWSTGGTVETDSSVEQTDCKGLLERRTLHRRGEYNRFSVYQIKIIQDIGLYLWKFWACVSYINSLMDMHWMMECHKVLFVFWFSSIWISFFELCAVYEKRGHAMITS